MINYIDCLNNANDFFEIACDIDKKRHEFEYKYLSVFATNLSFSCELYLKYLLIHTDEVTHGDLREHRLDVLFKKLRLANVTLCEKIEREYNAYMHVKSIKELLKTDKSVFVDFRYLYELNKNKQIHTTDLSNFARSLKLVANSLDK